MTAKSHITGVAVSTDTTGTGPITVGAPLSAVHFTPAQVGVVDGLAYPYRLTQGYDAVELGWAIASDSGTVFERHATQSRIAGTVSYDPTGNATRIDLDGSGKFRIVIGSDDFDDYLPKAGGTLTGPLTLPGNPTNDLHAATKQYTDAAISALLGANDVEVFKGPIDCSASPNYPAADAGHVYRVSVAGKIGGASGVNVEVGDRLQCVADGTAAGPQAAVGASWWITQANIDGAVVGPASATSGNVATFSGTTGKLIADGGKAIPTGSIVGTSDAQTLSNKTLTNPVVTNYSETVYAPAATSAITIDWANGTKQVITSSGNLTITLPAAVAGKGGTIYVVYGGTHTLTWAGGTALKYAGGTPPTPKGASGAVDCYVIDCKDSSTTNVLDGGRDIK